MANPEHLAILNQGVKVWNEWRKKNSEVHPDLSKAQLGGQDLQGINFRCSILLEADLGAANLKHANLAKADLRGTDFWEADLTGANLNKSNLGGTNLTQVRITKATMRGANLFGAVLSQSNMQKVDLTGASIGLTTFRKVDLSSVKGLTTLAHQGPSDIDLETIYNSGGSIPSVFLRSAGIPEVFVNFLTALVGKPIRFFSCFISHSTKDKQFCNRLRANLQSNEVPNWYFPEDAKWGEPVWGEIDHSIRIYDKLVIVCSKNSLTSGPVLREIERALNREDKEDKNILFPITLDDYIFDEWEYPRKADVLAKVVGDFRGWNRSAAQYDAAFKKLLKALKAD